MYKLVFDYNDTSRVYIYEDTEKSLKLKLIVHYDIDLAYRIVDILNDNMEEYINHSK
jgi:hypothetical protein